MAQAAFEGEGAPANFTAVAGSSTQADGKLVIDNNNARIIHAALTTLAGGQVAATVSSDTVGAEADLIGMYLDTNSYTFGRWKFAADQGELRIYRHNAGVSTLQDGGPYIFPGRGAGTTTRLTFCWGGWLQSASGIFTVDDGHGFRSRPLVYNTGGEKAGMGSGSVAGGSVKFDDFRFEYVQNGGAYEVCPTCCACQVGCAVGSTLCISIRNIASGILIDNEHPEPDIHCPSNFNGGFQAAGTGTCKWIYGTNNFVHSEVEIIIYRDESDQHYYSELALYSIVSGTATHLATFRRDLGIDNPDDYEEVFEGSVLTWHDGPEGCGFPEAIVRVYAGDCGTGSDIEESSCCEDDELPEILYVTDTVNGSPLGVDVEFHNTHPGFTGFQFDQVAPNTLGRRIQCDFSGGPPEPGTAEFLSGGAMGNVDLTVHSCSPFYATGTKVVGSDTYHIEVVQ